MCFETFLLLSLAAQHTDIAAPQVAFAAACRSAHTDDVMNTVCVFWSDWAKCGLHYFKLSGLCSSVLFKKKKKSTERESQIGAN